MQVSVKGVDQEWGQVSRQGLGLVWRQGQGQGQGSGQE